MFLPGIVVQNTLTMRRKSGLYWVNTDEWERLIISNIDLLSPFDVGHPFRRIWADYLASFLQDPGHSQLYYCDAMLQHIFICRHFFSLLDKLGSKSLDFQS
jgi:hypothetical protein